MTTEIQIGTKVEQGNFRIDAAQYGTVSRVHAKIVRRDDGIYLEDMNSANGTFVNGLPVMKKKVTVNDEITLAGKNGYRLNLEDVLKLIPMSDAEFAQQFKKLQEVYETYQKKLTETTVQGQSEMMTKRMLPMTLVGSLSGLSGIVPGIPMPVRIGLAALPVIVFMIASSAASKSMEKMRDGTNQLNEEFELNYVCPNCQNSLRGRSWAALEAAGKCPFCKRTF